MVHSSMLYCGPQKMQPIDAAMQAVFVRENENRTSFSMEEGRKLEGETEGVGVGAGKGGFPERVQIFNSFCTLAATLLKASCTCQIIKPKKCPWIPNIC